MYPTQLASANLQDDGFGNKLNLLHGFVTSRQWSSMVHYFEHDLPAITHLDTTWEHFNMPDYVDAVTLDGKSYLYMPTT